MAAEITAFDHVSARLFVANATFRTVDVYDMKDPAAPSPNKHPLLIVGNEASGTAAVFRIVLQ